MSQRNGVDMAGEPPHQDPWCYERGNGISSGCEALHVLEARIAELEEQCDLLQKAWDTEVEDANAARKARQSMQANWSRMVQQSKQKVNAAHLERDEARKLADDEFEIRCAEERTTAALTARIEELEAEAARYKENWLARAHAHDRACDELESVKAEIERLLFPLRYMVDLDNWAGDPHTIEAHLHGHFTPYELAMEALAETSPAAKDGKTESFDHADVVKANEVLGRSLGAQFVRVAELEATLTELVEWGQTWHDEVSDLTGSVDGFMVLDRARAALAKTSPADSEGAST